jgi:hypothetical protein
VNCARGSVIHVAYQDSSALALTGNDPCLLTKTDPPRRGDGSVQMSMNLEHPALAGLGCWDLRSD